MFIELSSISQCPCQLMPQITKTHANQGFQKSIGFLPNRNLSRRGTGSPAVEQNSEFRIQNFSFLFSFSFSSPPSPSIHIRSNLHSSRCQTFWVEGEFFFLWTPGAEGIETYINGGALARI